jgi:hypothetical protein
MNDLVVVGAGGAVGRAVRVGGALSTGSTVLSRRGRNEEWLAGHTVLEFHNQRQEARDQPPDPILRPDARE